MSRRVAALLLLGLTAGCRDTDSDLMVGQLEAERVEVSGPVSELIVSIPVTEGQRVGQGELLFQLDQAVADAARERAAAALAVSEAELAEIRRGPRPEAIAAAAARRAQAREDLALRVAALARVRELRDQELASDDDLDQARAAEKTARARAAEMDALLQELRNGATAEELARAEAAQRRARAELSMLELDQERLAVTAPVAGQVEQILFETGERPRAGEPVLTLLRTDLTYARIYVPAQLRLRAVAGAPVEITVQGREQPLAGVVRWVSAEAAFTPYFALTRHDRDRLTYPAEVTLPPEAGTLPAGLPVEARFVDR